MTDSTSADQLTSAKGAGTVRIATGARLHFGLLDTIAPFGGVGLMIDTPQTEIVTRQAESFACDSQLVERANSIVDRIGQFAGFNDRPPCSIELKQIAPPHSGLGSGTQLALAVAESVCRSIGLPIQPSAMATELASRGRRSAVGVHGYFAGGLILETGGDHQALNRVQCRATVNDAWQVAIFRPAGDFQPVSGKLEQQQFSVLSPATDDQRRELTDMAQRLVLAAQHNDFSSFVNLVQRYNRRSGLLFESVQGGPYNGHAVAELIDTLCERGARGVGQSSWGPGVFAWFESLEEAERFASGLPEGIETIAIARPQNNGRRLDLI